MQKRVNSAEVPRKIHGEIGGGPLGARPRAPRRREQNARRLARGEGYRLLARGEALPARERPEPVR